MSGRWRRMFAQPGMAGLVVALGLVAVNWPFLDLAREAGNQTLFAYFFGVWSLVVLLAFLISRAIARQETDGEDDV